MATIEIQPVRVAVRLPVMERRQATMRWVARLHCRHLGTIHSTDRVIVYSGRTMPARACGFHMSWGPAAQQSIRDAAYVRP
jgi:hypothetical protein